MLPYGGTSYRSQSPDRSSSSSPRKDKRARAAKKSRQSQSENDPMQAQGVKNERLSWRSSTVGLSRTGTRSSTPQPISAARYQEGLGTQQKVDAFLLSLPLGITSEDAAIESAVADRLTGLYEENTTLKGKLDQWMNAASELKDAVNDQQNEIEYLRKRDDIVSGLRTPQRPSESGYQQQEIAELKEMVTSLRRDLLSRQHSGTKQDLTTVLEELDRAQQEICGMQQDHEVALRDQANFHQRELEDLHFEMQNLEALIQDQNMQLSENVAATEQAEKAATDLGLELRSLAEEKEFMVLQIEELTEENLRLQKLARNSMSFSRKEEDQLSATPERLTALKAKTPPVFDLQNASLQEWRLEACWPGDLEREQSVTPEGAQLESQSRRSSCATVTIDSHTPEPGSGGEACGESETDTPEHLKEVLELEMLPEAGTVSKIRPLFELSPPQTIRKPCTAEESGASRPRSAESVSGERLRSLGSVRHTETACQTDMDQHGAVHTSVTRSGDAAAIQSTQARVAELEQQLQESGKKFTKELGSIIEMHEAKVAEADAGHQRNVALLKAELLEAKQLHSAQLEKACEEYREDRDQLADELLSVRESLAQQKQAANDAHLRHVEECSDLQAQLQQQKGLEEAIAEDLQQVNAVVASQAIELQGAQTALTDSLGVLRQLRAEAKDAPQHERADAVRKLQLEVNGLENEVAELREQLTSSLADQSSSQGPSRISQDSDSARIHNSTLKPCCDGSDSVDGKSQQRPEASGDVIDSPEELLIQISELEELLLRSRQEDDFHSESHASEMLALHQAHQERVDSLQAQLKDRQQHIQELKDALEEEGTKAERAENALLDCQEMLEEIQAFSEHQALQIAAGCQDAQAVGGKAAEEELLQMRTIQCNLAMELEGLKIRVRELDLARTEAESASDLALAQSKSAEQARIKAEQQCQALQDQLQSVQSTEAQLQIELTDLCKKEKQAELRLAQAREQNTRLSELHNSHAVERDQLLMRVEEMRIEQVAAAASQKVREHEILQIQDESTHLQESQIRLRTELQAAEEQRQSLTLDLGISEERVQTLSGQLQQYEDMQSALASKNEELQAVQTILGTVVEEKEEATAALATAIRSAEDLQAEMRKLEGHLSSVASQLETAGSKNTDLEGNVQALTDDKQKLERELSEAQTTIECLQTSIEKAKAEAAELTAELNASKDAGEQGELESETLQPSGSEAEDSGLKERCVALDKQLAEQAEVIQDLKAQQMSYSLRARVRRSLDQEAVGSPPRVPPSPLLPMSASKAAVPPTTPMSQLRSKNNPRMPQSTKNYRSLTGLSAEAVRELHFNPVFGETSPSRPRRLILPGLMPPASDRVPNHVRIGRTKATSPNRWVRAKAENGSPRWQPEETTIEDEEAIV